MVGRTIESSLIRSQGLGKNSLWLLNPSSKSSSFFQNCSMSLHLSSFLSQLSAGRLGEGCPIPLHFILSLSDSFASSQLHLSSCNSLKNFVGSLKSLCGSLVLKTVTTPNPFRIRPKAFQRFVVERTCEIHP